MRDETVRVGQVKLIPMANCLDIYDGEAFGGGGAYTTTNNKKIRGWDGLNMAPLSPFSSI